MNPVESFQAEVAENIRRLGQDQELHALSREWMEKITHRKYAYNFRWLGRPIIQVPQDVIAMQELIFSIQPELVVETGIAHGGSLVFSASILELNAICGGPREACVLGVDIDIRAHNRAAIEAHPMSRRIAMLQGSSIAPDVVAEVRARAAGKRTLVFLDSNHTHDHVLAELDAYAPLVSVGSYCVVFDSVIEDLPADMFPDRPWGPGDNPKTAARAWVKEHPEFVVDRTWDAKLLLTVAPEGFLKRVR